MWDMLAVRLLERRAGLLFELRSHITGVHLYTGPPGLRGGLPAWRGQLPDRPVCGIFSLLFLSLVCRLACAVGGFYTYHRSMMGSAAAAVRTSDPVSAAPYECKSEVLPAGEACTATTRSLSSNKRCRSHARQPPAFPQVGHISLCRGCGGATRGVSSSSSSLLHSLMTSRQQSSTNAVMVVEMTTKRKTQTQTTA